MSRLTKLEIERRLLSGLSLSWKDSAGKSNSIKLETPAARRLFQFLLRSDVRSPTELPNVFIDGLQGEISGEYDPADTHGEAGENLGLFSWKLKSILTEGFGGINVWAGAPFEYSFDRQSLLIEGPNGSGKSSLIGAILWTLSGERLRDQTKSLPHALQPVFGENQKPIGSWPPIATYPPTEIDLTRSPKVRVELVFENENGEIARVERRLENGDISVNADPLLYLPDVLIETSLLMPSRLPLLRLDEGAGQLTSAVQKLTGLDDLIALGALVSGLCNGGREYLSYRKKELALERVKFDRALVDCEASLKSIDVTIPGFAPSDTKRSESKAKAFGKELVAKAAELTEAVRDDLSPDLELSKLAVQTQVSAALEATRSELGKGLQSLASWNDLETVHGALDDETVTAIEVAIDIAIAATKDAVGLLARSQVDNRFRLKAMAARWHVDHAIGPIDDCPLCQRVLQSPELKKELEGFRALGELATRQFEDNMNLIAGELDRAVPSTFRRFGENFLASGPSFALARDFTKKYIDAPNVSEILHGFKRLAGEALKSIPQSNFDYAVEQPVEDAATPSVNRKIETLRRFIALAKWYRDNAADWLGWWNRNALPRPTTSPEAVETLGEYLGRLADALREAEPYRKAAVAMRDAWSAGLVVSEIEDEQERRKAVSNEIGPLKDLSSLAESVARDAINDLSGRIAATLDRIHLAENLKFKDTSLRKKDGLTVFGNLVSDYRIDATLVANTSWLRAVLWAFIFALREEALEQLGKDGLPLFLFDDPQTTFDPDHRHRWCQHVAAMQQAPRDMQVILATHDPHFVELIKIGGVTGREAMIASAHKDIGYLAIIEGDALARRWDDFKSHPTPLGGRDYIGKVREHVEGLLRIMLRAEDANVSAVGRGFTIGDARSKIEHLHAKGFAPWDRSEFKALTKSLHQNLTSIKHMEMAHHASGLALGIAEAEDVEKHWRKELRPAIEACSAISREYRLLHAPYTALFSPPPSISLPNGYKSSVRKMKLEIIGRAAALSGGRAADGMFQSSGFDSATSKKIVLAQHAAYRCVSSTLEPVAKVGDIVLVKDAAEPSAKSLVIAISGGKLLARRFEIADNHSDVAVLTAQAINPRNIAPPIIAKKATLTLHKVVGVLYQRFNWVFQGSDHEVSDCGGTSAIDQIAEETIGLIEVVGQSAEPFALDKQHLMILPELQSLASLSQLDGRPVVACDADDNYYFKRLRFTNDASTLVLESLDSGGDHGPIVLAAPGFEGNSLRRVWPVAGVLFELPN
ncbi:AAA family ATPase [Rhizobium sp. NXC24]|uniref:AAA family ATPase n=1 Tax=Rhizobium sp. NXC24 TaxID=2048897 RepID=UPI00131A5A87|nr:AAA family ATPase [Rhizobium sp. NXC24]